MAANFMREHAEAQNRRVGERRPMFLCLEVRALDSEQVYTISIQNLSETGALVHANANFDIGQNVSVRISDTTWLQATVMWTDCEFIGLSFARRLSKAEYSTMRLRGFSSHDQIALTAQQPYDIDVGKTEVGAKLPISMRVWIIAGATSLPWLIVATVCWYVA